MPTTIEKKARDLAVAHYKALKPQQILWFQDAEKKIIRFVEIRKGAIPSPGRVIVTLFSPMKGMTFPFAIAEITPEDWKKITSGELKLPGGWDLNNYSKIEKPAQPKRVKRA